MSQLPINSSASDIQELFAAGQTPVYELTEEKSMDELLAEFGWLDQRTLEQRPATRQGHLNTTGRTAADRAE